MMVRQYTPTAKQRDERVNTELEPVELVKAMLRAGPHTKDAEAEAEAPKKKPKKKSISPPK